MLHIRDDIPASELVALKFSDRENFYAATILMAERLVCAEPVEHYTIVVRRADQQIFKGLSFEVIPVRDRFEAPNP